MEGLHKALTDHFLAALRKDEVPAALLKEIRQFLVDNHVEASSGAAKQLARDFLDKLPTYEP